MTAGSVKSSTPPGREVGQLPVILKQIWVLVKQCHKPPIYGLMVYTTHKMAKFGDGLLLLYHALPILSMNKLRKTYSKIQSLTEFDLNCRNFRFRPMPYVTIKNCQQLSLSLSMATFVIKWPQSCGSHGAKLRKTRCSVNEAGHLVFTIMAMATDWCALGSPLSLCCWVTGAK